MAFYRVLGYIFFNLLEPEGVINVRIIWIVTVITNNIYMYIYNARASSIIIVNLDTLTTRLEHQVGLHFQ